MAVYCEHCASWMCFKAHEIEGENHLYEESFEDFVKLHPNIEEGYGGIEHKKRWEEVTGKRLTCLSKRHL